MSTATGHLIHIPAAAIATVRTGALTELGIAAEDLHRAVSAYELSSGRKGQESYEAAADRMAACQQFLELIGDDLAAAPKPIDLHPGWADEVLRAVRHKAADLRDELRGTRRPTAELRALVDLIDALEALGAQVPD